MKRILTFLVLMIMAVTSVAQSGTNESNHDGPNVTIGVAPQLSLQAGHPNVGVTGTVAKYITQDVALRFSLGVNGFVPVHDFDRYGAAFVGVSYEFTKWLSGCLDVGASYNPSSKDKIGPAAAIGVGFQHDFGRCSRLFASVGTDATYNNRWLITPNVKVGYAVRIGRLP
jgi:hypothetical protein